MTSAVELEIGKTLTLPVDQGRLAEAYVALLRMPHSSLLRLKNQALLAACRDALAEAIGEEPEAVQNYFEAHVVNNP